MLIFLKPPSGIFNHLQFYFFFSKNPRPPSSFLSKIFSKTLRRHRQYLSPTIMNKSFTQWIKPRNEQNPLNRKTQIANHPTQIAQNPLTRFWVKASSPVLVQLLNDLRSDSNQKEPILHVWDSEIDGGFVVVVIMTIVWLWVLCDLSFSLLNPPTFSL